MKMSIFLGSGDDYIPSYIQRGITLEQANKEAEENRIKQKALDDINLVIRVNKLEAENASYRLTIKLLKEKIESFEKINV